ncbi:MAG: threonine--tRNA ligase [Theionarchaea archaeon]|nr:threonine--tRNA ligase [Theionarchaea archaeon]
MKILALHSDFMEYEITKKTSMAEEIPDMKGSDRMENVLAVFTTVESVDETNPHIVEDASSEISSIAQKVNTTQIMVYPYAHLSSDLASAQKAIPILKELAQTLQDMGYTVKRSPFGYYKSFSLKCKGHPLSELSRSILPRPEVEEKEEQKEAKFFRFIVVSGDGTDYEVTPQNWKSCSLWQEQGTELLKTFTRNELQGNPQKKGKPKHIEFMQRLELVDYTPESDVGNMKWYPNGLLIKDLILDYQEVNVARPYGAFKIQNPLLYRTDVPEIRMLMGEFHERDYKIENENLVLRFASDPGAFPYMQKVTFSYKNMPIREYEEAICFRKEQKGELSGLRRVRNFLMTDVHAFCMDVDQANEEFLKLSLLCKELMDSIITKNRWVMGWEIVEQFYDEHKEWILQLIKTLGVPSLIKIMKERSHYYTMKNEFQSIEADGVNSQISTVQMDFVNGERFNISYTGEDGKEYPCIILHCSTFGSIERAVCSILENAAIDHMEGKKPQIPLWLAPAQIRLIPVSENHHEFCTSILSQVTQVRVDIDDRNETLSSRIRDAERAWIPFICIIGDKEIESGTLSVRCRDTGQETMSLQELVTRVTDETQGMPFRPLALPVLLSKRPKFR